MIITSYVQNEEAQVGMCKMSLSSFFVALPFSCCAVYCYLWDFRICYCLLSIKFCWGCLVFSCFVNFGIVILCVIVHWGLVKMEERYKPLKDLSVGNFGVARLVRDKKTKELVAVKYIEKGKKVISIWSKVNSVMLWVLQMFVLEVVMCFFFLMFYFLLNLKL